MFTIVQGIQKDITGTLFKPTFSERRGVINETITNIAKKICPGLDFSIHMSRGLDSFSPSVVLSSKEIKIFLSPLSYVKMEDIPTQFQFTSSKDPSLKNNRKVQGFFDAVADKLRLKREKITLMHKLSLRFILHLTEKKEKAKDTLIFGLAHELGHIQNKDHLKKFKFTTWMKIVNILTFGLFKWFREQRFFHKIELAADRFAALQSKDIAKGGVFGFKSLLKSVQAMRKTSCLTRFCTLPNGDFWLPCFTKSHPNFNLRLKRIRNLLQTQT